MVLTSTTITTILVTIQQLYSQLNKYLCRALYPTADFLFLGDNNLLINEN